jgi:hypothetical protein
VTASLTLGAQLDPPLVAVAALGDATFAASVASDDCRVQQDLVCQLLWKKRGAVVKRTEDLLLRLIRRHRLDVGDREVLDQIAVRVQRKSARRRGMALDNACSDPAQRQKSSAHKPLTSRHQSRNQPNLPC